MHIHTCIPISRDPRHARSARLEHPHPAPWHDLFQPELSELFEADQVVTRGDLGAEPGNVTMVIGVCMYILGV